ncbi:MAG: RDD family protein [Bacteroidota bacterium]
MSEKVEITKKSEENKPVQTVEKTEDGKLAQPTGKGLKVKSNRFQIDRLEVSPELDGVILASFSQRFFAFMLDLGVLFSLTVFWWFLIIVFLVMKLSTRKLKKSVKRVNVSIGMQLRSIDKRLQRYDVEDQLRSQFKKHLRIYLKVIIYLPIVLALVFLVMFVVRLISNESTETGGLLVGWIDLITNSLSPLNFLIGGFVSVLYFGVMNYWFQGQTLGKKIFKIRVVKLNGKPMSFWGSIERATGYTASGSLFLYGFFQYFWDRNRQTTHDKITETIVIKNRKH